MIKKRILFVILGISTIFPVFSQGALEVEPDPQVQLIQALETSNDFIPVPEIPVLYTHPNDGRLAEVAYGQFARVLRGLLVAMESGGVEAGFDQIPILRELVLDWAVFWNSYAFLPEDGQVTSSKMKEFLQSIHTIDSEVTETIAQMNEIIDQERVLTSASFRF